MTPTKPPTPQGISALLRKAGFERAAISIRGGNSGFKVEKCRARAGAVKVRAYFLIRMSDQAYGAMLRRYRDAIEAAGYSTEVGTYHLVVTAKPASLLAAKDGDN
jgi:uncharacterized glyoxalase superfamily metalloenzyme YdcJ